MIYRAYAGGKEIKDFNLGGRGIDEIWGGDVLLWKKENEDEEFSFIWKDLLAIYVSGKGTIYPGDGTSYEIDNKNSDINLAKEGVYTAKIIGKPTMIFFSTYTDGLTRRCGVTEVLSPFPKSMNANAQHISGIFFDNTLLEKIPGNLLENLPDLTNANSMFYNTSISEIPADLFKKSKKIESFQDCFGKTKITTLPSGLFDECTLAKNFAYCFEGTDIASIPFGIFGKNISAESFNGCFRECRKLQTVPNMLFAGLDKAEHFQYCFSYVGSENITALKLPDDIFQGCTAARDFHNCFEYAQISEIPSGLFKDCIEACDVENCFWGATEIVSVADDVFDNCTKITSFRECFANGTGKKSKMTTAPKLWMRFPGVDGYNCFYKQYNLEFWEEIPSDWK